jgi:hypothetical protein
MKKLLSALVFFLGLQTFAVAQGLPVPSLWQNQRGSTLQINALDPFGHMSGTFINRAAGFQCRNTPYPATGYYSNPGITFTVSFTQCNSITVWNGQVNGNIMPTSWVLTYQGGTQTGSDTFQLVTSRSRKK